MKKILVFLCASILVSCNVDDKIEVESQSVPSSGPKKSNNNTQQSTKSKSINIVIFGDSHTKGGSFVDILKNYTSHNIIRSGIGGEKTASGSGRLSSAILSNRATSIIVLEGTNDVLRHSDISTTRSAYLNMISIARMHNTRIAFCTIPPLANDRYSQHIKQVNDIIKSLGVPVIDINSRLNNSHLQSDGIHLNQNGNQVVAEEIGKRI